ncbi:hypothetical protein QAD02_003137 [Eretmocerus hayati]|uniref:Uncharacterized protein n=1 Tax=Eretmocerus hayati TaxID=131215 RepID=A0ACC2NLV8_9HYME|nr:hypothetical protein QAD02_003137 [Eretmocerus hayati]
MELLTIRGQSPVILLVDLQGFEFVSDGVFIVKEAVVTNVESLGEYYHWLFNPPYSKEVLDLADWRALEYASYHHHGLQWDDGLIPYDRVAHYFERVLRSECKQDRNMRIYVSGRKKKLWLQQLANEFFNSRADVTVVNLYDEFNISGSDYMYLDYEYDMCNFHCNSTYVCALRRVYFMAHVIGECPPKEKWV